LKIIEKTNFKKLIIKIITVSLKKVKEKEEEKNRFKKKRQYEV
jgi:hypothetical protein